uniref:Protein FAM107B-like n=1 Tax=Sinocyclocheilus grahami TaxID=75366 RepID=A0A672NRY3_SINGR
MWGKAAELLLCHSRALPLLPVVPLVTFCLLRPSESSSGASTASQQASEGQDDLIRPKKLFNPVLESSSRRGLHRELLVSLKTVCRGLLPEEKPELKRVLEQRRLEQHREREQASHLPSDLEQELHKRSQRLLQEELRRREDLQNMPEFVRVRENLRHITVTGY